jgi:competence protein ComEC
VGFAWRQDGPWIAGLVALALTCATLAAALLGRPDGLLHLWALDVGQGDALLIETPDGHYTLIDGGPDAQTLETRLGARLPFWDRDLALVVLTHPHEDHLTGLIDALKRYHVEGVLETPYEQGTPQLEDEWHGELKLAETPVRQAVAGQVVALQPGVTLRVLYPGPALRHGTHSDINNSSVVTRLEYGAVSMLLTGDVETEAVGDLLAAGPEALASDVLKAPHHGSNTGLSPALLAAAHPRVAFISVGRGNPYGHPAPETLRLLRDAGVPVYRTDEQGTIEFLSDGAQLWVRAER